MSSNPGLNYSILSYLSSPSLSASIASSPARQSKLESAIKDLEEALDLNTQDPQVATKYGGGPGLETIYQVFERTQKKMGASAQKEETTPSTSTSTSVPAASASKPEPTESEKAEAESLKASGNKSMSAKDFGGAIASYTKALELYPDNPVYYSNRAAAYSQLGQHDKAVEDAQEAIRCDEKFSKAYSRLGHAHFASGNFPEAVKAYEKGLEVDPANATMKNGLETARSQVASSSSASSNTDSVSRGAPGAGAGAGGNPFAGLGGMGGGGGGGMPDLSALLNNPMISQMAQQMMQNGGLEQLMNNPMMRQMAERMGAGGGMPDLNAMMQDPNIQNLARQFGGGAGRGNGGGNQGDDGDNSGMYS